MSRIPASPDFDPRIADWLEADPDLAPREVLSTTLAAFPSIPQRRASRVPRRFQTMNCLALFGAAAAIVVAAGLGGLALSSRSSATLAPAPTQSAAPTTPASSASVSPVTPDLDPARLTAAFVSDHYGYTIPVNPGWTTHQATVTWTGPDNSRPVIDDLGMSISGASQALARGQTLSQWLETFQSEENAASPCYGGPSSTWPTRQIGGRAWKWQQGCQAVWAITEDGGRTYVFGCGGCTPAAEELNALFDAMLSSVQLDPRAAAKAPPPPPLTQPFVGDRNGFELRVPADWSVAQRATGAAPRDRLPELADAGLDVLGNDTLRLAVTSFPLRNGETATEWAGAFCDFAHTVWSPSCDQAPGAWQTVPLASGTAWLAVDGDTAATFPQDNSRLFLATAVAGGRAYEIRLEGAAEESLFIAILASMDLHPGQAADATPRP